MHRQVEAYNAGEVDAFVACYAQNVVIEDADGPAAPGLEGSTPSPRRGWEIKGFS